MNIRKNIYLWVNKLRKIDVAAHYDQMLCEDAEGIQADTTRNLLVRLLTHCMHEVPYYKKIMKERGDSFSEDPEGYLSSFPILDKNTIRENFDLLKSSDLSQRRWFYNTSGGSTGEPAKFIQDYEYIARSGAIGHFFFKQVGKELGELEIYLWGSLRDIVRNQGKWSSALLEKINNRIYLNAFRMTLDDMKRFIEILNARHPKLIVSYAECMYELSRFAERQNCRVRTQHAIITSAGTLFPYMRESIERVFQCKVYNLYGSREVSKVACERPGQEGLWVAPWGNYIEIVDENLNLVPSGTEGEILVTSLINFAMPLIRYRIGDRGVLSPSSTPGVQVLQHVTGRTADTFKTKKGALIYAGFFAQLLYFREWVQKFQVIQKSHSHIVFRILPSNAKYSHTELEDIAEKTRFLMGEDCKIDFDFTDRIEANGSGKYRYEISEI